MIIIVDGTGDFSNESYNKAMGASFCSRLSKEVAKNGKYFRGPSVSGMEVGGIAGKAFEAANSIPNEEPLFLCGYSRGGLVAIVVARMLHPRAVKAMFLFDAVARALLADGSRISNNVKSVYHARRDPIFTQEPAKTARMDLGKANAVSDGRSRLISALMGPDPKVNADRLEQINRLAIAQNANFYARNETGVSVANFGNTGLAVAPETTLDTKVFPGSHGALGGVPWSEDDIKGDTANSRKVQSWMWARLIKEGVLNGKPLR